jgi:hypothetical protein
MAGIKFGDGPGGRLLRATVTEPDVTRVNGSFPVMDESVEEYPLARGKWLPEVTVTADSQNRFMPVGFEFMNPAYRQRMAEINRGVANSPNARFAKAMGDAQAVRDDIKRGVYRPSPGNADFTFGPLDAVIGGLSAGASTAKLIPRAISGISNALGAPILNTGVTANNVLGSMSGYSLGKRLGEIPSNVSNKDWEAATKNVAMLPLDMFGVSGLSGVRVTNPFRSGTPAANQVAKEFFGQKLKDAGLLRPETNVELLSRYPNLEENITKAALKKFNTTYRSVNTDVQGMINDMDINDLVGMMNKGVNVENPVEVAKYMATHVPHGKYGYRASMASPGPGQDVINTARSASEEEALNLARLYGDEGASQYLVKVRPKDMDFSTGTKEDWFNRYFQNKPFAIRDGEYNPEQILSQEPSFRVWKPGTIATRYDPSQPNQYWPYIGFRGEQLLTPVKTIKVK